MLSDWNGNVATLVSEHTLRATERNKIVTDNVTFHTLKHNQSDASKYVMILTQQSANIRLYVIYDLP